MPDDQGVYKPDPSYNTNPYDPKAQTTSFMGTLAESDAPGVVGNVKDEDEVDAEEAEAKGAEATEEPGGVPMLEELDEK